MLLLKEVEKNDEMIAFLKLKGFALSCFISILEALLSSCKLPDSILSIK